MNKLSISDFGEKKLIDEIIKPMFNPDNDPDGIGDDCCVVSVKNNEVLLLSTDRVPYDLIAFRIGLLDYKGLGSYLARLNISDLSACGGTPIGVLLNLGLPKDFLLNDFISFLEGIKHIVEGFNCKVLGGDITSSEFLNISATSIGKVERGFQLTRRNAKQGDFVFVSKPIGLTPAAFKYFLNLKKNIYNISSTEKEILLNQFTTTLPLVNLGKKLANSGLCTSCIDNTDGLGQSLSEISKSSNVSIDVYEAKLIFHNLVSKISNISKIDRIDFAFGAGADFSLVGTLNGNLTKEEISEVFNNEIQIIGKISEGTGVRLIDKNNESRELNFTSWNYFL